MSRTNESLSHACDPVSDTARSREDDALKMGMRLKMLVKSQIQIFHGRSPGLFSNEPFEKRPVMTIEDFVVHFDDYFESHSLGSGLCCTGR